MKICRLFMLVSSPLLALAQASILTAVLEELPACGRTCLVQEIELSTCAATNITCICTNTNLTAKVEACVATACSIKESLSTKNITLSSCGAPIRDRTKDVSYTGIIGGIIALIAVGLRLLARLPAMGGGFGWDDAVMLLTLLPMLPLTVLSVFLANAGLGKDMWTVTPANITRILYIYYFDESLYISALSLIKISICCFYLRIFPERRFRYIVYLIIGCCAAYAISFVIAVSLQCSPVNLAWKRWDGEHEYGHCVNVNSLGWASASFNIILDVATITLPLPQLMRLALSPRRKIQVIMMFSIGSFVTIVSILRLKWMLQFASSENITWDYVPIGYWSTIEVHAGMLCACLPAIRALLYQYFPKALDRSTVAKNYAYNTKYGGGTGAIGTNTSIVQRVTKADEDTFIPLEDVDADSIDMTRKSGMGVQVRTQCYHA